MPTDSDRPTSGKGVDMGAGEGSTFEPEEDAAVEDSSTATGSGAEHGHVRTESETDVDDALGGADDPSR